MSRINPLGTWRMRSLGLVREVTGQRQSWDEKDERESRWCSVEHAMALIDEPGLRHVIARFAQTMRVAVH